MIRYTLTDILVRFLFNKFKPTKVVDKKWNYTYDIGNARRLTFWFEEDFYKYYRYAYELENGEVFMYEEKHFVLLQNTDIYRYKTIKEFEQNWFPDPKEKKLEPLD